MFKNKTFIANKPVKYLLDFFIFGVILAIAIVLLNLIFSKVGVFGSYETIDVSKIESKNQLPVIIIDPGHGGEDGGAKGHGDIVEKHLNLTISQNLYDLLRVNGFQVVMTRETDTALYDRNVDFKGRKKMLDLKARLELTKTYENAIFVSIHMNAFPDDRYSGLHVFYSPNHENSYNLAGKVQHFTKQYLQENNNREVKKAGSNIFLLNRIKHPAILIECGFLSNYTEAEKLTTEEYQKQLSFIFYSSILDYLTSVDLSSNNIASGSELDDDDFDLEFGYDLDFDLD